MINKQYFLLDKKDWVLDSKSVEYLPFWKEQKKYCIEGKTVGGLYIPGRLYFYMNYGTIEIDAVDSRGASFKTRGKPYFRDIDWELFQQIEKAEQEHRGLIYMTGRGAGKSFSIASVVAQRYTFHKDSECVVSSEEDKYIAPFMMKTRFIIDSLPFPFKQPRQLGNDWSKEVRSGFKDKKTGEIDPKSYNSRILVRNYTNNTMAANGTRPKIHVFEEIGTMGKLVQCYEDSVSCWRDDSGQGGVPILIGTGGDMEKGRDAFHIFTNPEQFNLLTFTDVWETGKQIGLFVPATKAKNQFKESKPLSEYLQIENEPDLKEISILVSKEAEAKASFEIIRAQKRKGVDNTPYLKERMYNPFVPSEVFLRKGGNRFDAEALRKHLYDLEVKFGGNVGLSVDLFETPEGIVKSRASQKKPIVNFPMKDEDSKEGAIMIYEYPVENPPYGMYIAGCDPYDQDKAAYSTSLGSIKIFKQFTGLNETGAKREIVAEYTGRPPLASQFYEICRLLLKYYNAKCLAENQNMGIFTYFINKGQSHYLAPTPEFVRVIAPTETTRSLGIHAAPKIVNYGLGLIKEYLEEELYKEVDDEGNITKLVLGLVRIKDIGLVKELMAYNDDDAKANFDRVVAFYHALMYEEELMKYTKSDMESIKQGDSFEFFSNTRQFYKRNSYTRSI